MKILIIEDSQAIRETLQDLLEINGHTVRAAADGLDGVKLAAERPELILCDIAMPGMDGFAVIQAIQQLPQCRDVPFIFLTAMADREDQRRGMALGADDYITKPFNERDVLDAIAARVRRQSSIRGRLEQLLDEKHREISADWSHELMTPMNGVLGGLELIEMEADTIKPEEMKELLAIVRAGAERQQRLSQKLIRYFELQRLKEMPPVAGLGRCRAEAVVAAGAERAAKEEKRPTDLRMALEPAQVAGSERLLVDAIAELVANALRFSAPGSPVDVTGRHVDQFYRIEIIDRGPGLTAEQRESVGAFKQFDRNRKEQQGLGLGLAIARDTASVSGGRLALQEGPDRRGLKVVIDLAWLPRS